MFNQARLEVVTLILRCAALCGPQCRHCPVHMGTGECLYSLWAVLVPPGTKQNHEGTKLERYYC